MNIPIRLIVVCDDYHDIDHIAQSIVGLKMSSRELGTIQDSYTRYVGIIFENSIPGDAEIFDLLHKAGIELDEEN